MSRVSHINEENPNNDRVRDRIERGQEGQKKLLSISRDGEKEKARGCKSMRVRVFVCHTRKVVELDLVYPSVNKV